MPSPVGHVIAGVTAGWLVAGAPLVAHKFRQKEKIRQATFETFGWEAAVFGALGACPDIDLLFGAHRGPTHSIAAALVVGFVVWTVIRAGGARRPLTFAVACFAAYASHPLLDWLGRDSSPPIGIMAFWPVSRDYFESTLHVFMPISRRYHQGATFVMQNALAFLRELSILIPLLILVVMFRRRRDGVDPLKWGSAALVIAVVGSLGAPAVQAADGYPDWIGWYRSGEHEKAVAAVRAHLATYTIPAKISGNVSAWNDGRVRAKNSDLLQAALMMHTEAVFEARVWMGQDVQRKLVRKIYEDLTSINPRTVFLKHWTLLWESFHQGQIYLLPAGDPDYLSMTLRAAPQDADLLLAAGSRHEVRWWKAAGSPQRDPAGAASTEESLSKAASLLRQSIAAGPTLMEAHLRLARVLFLLGNTDGAAEELRALQASSAEPSIRYLAYLFEGRLHERRDARSGALAAYQTAIGLVPVAQAARLAAARLAYADGSRRIRGGGTCTDNGGTTRAT